MMKPSLSIQCALVMLCALALLWNVPDTAAQQQGATDAVKHVYVCGCGPTADCNAIAAQPGKAPCGKPLVDKPVLKEDADHVYVCPCPEGCECGLSATEPGKCSCGKELRAYPKQARVGCMHNSGCAGCTKPCAARPPAAVN
jgi:hypothetical protein